MAKPSIHPWPRLSEDLPGAARPDACQSCGGGVDLARWREHDDRDQPTPILVVLCEGCSDRLVERHPRLYGRVHAHEPMPGTMLELCIDCRHRDGVRCRLARCHGGPGVKIGGAVHFTAHVLRSPRRLSGWTTFWTSPATRCSGREVEAAPIPRESPAGQGTLFDPAGGTGPYGGR